MLSNLWESITQTGQTTVFISIGLLGFIYLAVSALFGGLGHDGDGGHDASAGDGHDGDTTVSIFSFKVIAIFLVGFGGIGAIMSHNGFSSAASVSGGLCSGVVFGLVGWSMLRAMYRQQSNSAIDTNNAVGQLGQVTVGIPQDGIGEVGVTVQGSYSTFSARTESGQPISFGRRVKVKSNAGGQLVVEAV
ncbi:MAG: hypothetical protein HZA81_02855 [Candidatus Taylorbacteria bacterium]|nr:hypothetical protein [Candidatus Taylorbacteria bacterium]